MIILITVIGVLYVLFSYGLIIYGIGLVIGLIIYIMIALSKNNPLTSNQMEEMNKYDERLRNGELSEKELDNIILNNESVWNMFRKYYAGTEFMFDLITRAIELDIERFSQQDDPKGTNFNKVKNLELRLEENIKRKQEWLNKNKEEGLVLDYYGNHGELKLRIGDTFTIKDISTCVEKKFTIVEKENQDEAKGLISNDLPIAVKVANSPIGKNIEMKYGDKIYQFKIMSKS